MKTRVIEVIEQGQITVRPALKQVPYIIRVLDRSDLMDIMELQFSVIATIEQKELYVPISEEEMRYLFDGNGEAIGLYIQDKLYAACSILWRVDYEHNMGRELNFSDEELSLVAQLELSLVDSDLRGHKLQYRMADILARRVAAEERCRYLFTTVSPHNYASIQTVTALGLQVVKLCKMYYDWDRYVVCKDFNNPVQLDTANSINILNTSFAEQHQLLNKGYRGFSQLRDIDGIKIMYAKTLKEN